MRYATKNELEAMNKRLTELEGLAVQQSTIIGELSLLINGHQKLGIDGLAERQRKDDHFRQQVIDGFRKVGEEINEQADDMLRQVDVKLDAKIQPIVTKVDDLMDWRSAINRTVAVVTSNKVWRAVFFVMVLLISLGVFIKLKLLNLILPK